MLGAWPLSTRSWLARRVIPPALVMRMSPEPAPPSAAIVVASRWMPSVALAPRAIRAMLPARVSLALARI